MLTIVTGNSWKYSQISGVLKDIVQTRQEKIDLEEIQTTDLKEISADKAMKAFKIVQWPVVVDDSWMLFDAYPWFPGAMTKFLYEWVGLEGIQRLYQWVENRNAQFVCVLSYMDQYLDAPKQFVGVVEWELTFDRLWKDVENPKLPYDLIFRIAWMHEPVFYHMDVWKWEKSHRFKASKVLGEWLRNK
jgi:non-canonical purine NTP pyrophosphatase (RdgB/HAM1 family)